MESCHFESQSAPRSLVSPPCRPSFCHFEKSGYDPVYQKMIVYGRPTDAHYTCDKLTKSLNVHTPIKFSAGYAIVLSTQLVMVWSTYMVTLLVYSTVGVSFVTFNAVDSG